LWVSLISFIGCLACKQAAANILKIRANNIFLFIFLSFAFRVAGQTVPFKENTRWGIRNETNIIVPAIYDTIFNYDSTGKVCLGCFKLKSASANRFIKVISTAYSCNYLDKNNQRLTIRNGGDTCSVFSLAKNTIAQFLNNDTLFTANVKGRNHLVTKDFRQITSKGYKNITVSNVPGMYITQELSESETLFTGLVNSNEDQVVPYQYSGIRINPVDSIIIACSAGVRPNAEDDIYDYSGKKTDSYRRHIETATKNYIIHKMYEPKEHFILFNIKTREEKKLIAQEVKPSANDELLIRVKDDWYFYDLKTNTKKPKQS
jgi:hypothetical protein